MAVVEPANVERFMEICAKWDVLATVVGEVIEGDRLIIDWHGETIVDVDPQDGRRTRAPSTTGRYARPELARRGQRRPRRGPAPRQLGAEALQAALIAVAGSPQPVRQDLGHRPVRPLRARQLGAGAAGGRRHAADRRGDRARHRAGDRRQLALLLLNPYLGAQLSLAEAYRNVAVTGAEPVAITDCLNFGSPEDPDVMWQFAEADHGPGRRLPRARRARHRRQRVASTTRPPTAPILPTPIVGVLGVIDDVATRIRSGFAHPGDAIVLLGETREELSGSIWASASSMTATWAGCRRPWCSRPRRRWPR